MKINVLLCERNIPQIFICWLNLVVSWLEFIIYIKINNEDQMCSEICILMKTALFETRWKRNVLTLPCYWAIKRFFPVYSISILKRNQALVCQIKLHSIYTHTHTHKNHPNPGDHKENHADPNLLSRSVEAMKCTPLKLLNQSLSDFHSNTHPPSEH